MAANPYINVYSAVTPELRDEVNTILAKERITMSEFIRFCLLSVRDTGTLPISVPEELRGKTKSQGAAKASAYRTFFG